MSLVNLSQKQDLIKKLVMVLNQNAPKVHSDPSVKRLSVNKCVLLLLKITGYTLVIYSIAYLYNLDIFMHNKKLKSFALRRLQAPFTMWKEAKSCRNNNYFI